MKKIFSKNIIRAAVFLCIAALMVAGFSRVFRFVDAERTNTVMEQFYELEEDSAECIFFGSSVTQRDYITPVAYHEFGIPAYLIATGTQPFWLTKYLMIEALKTQSPKLFVVELKGTCKSVDWTGDVHVRRVVDNMKPSMNKLKAIMALRGYFPEDINGIDSTGLSYCFPIIKYHSLWSPNKWPKEYDYVDYYNGYSPKPEFTFSIRHHDPFVYKEDTLQIDGQTEEALYELLDFCDTLEDTRVLFVMPPYKASKDGMGKMNYSKEIVESRGYEVLNMLPEERRQEIGLDNRFSYYDKEHLNYYGAGIYTEYFFKYLIDNYGLEDMRGKGGHEAWEEEYERLMKDLDTRYSVMYFDLMHEIDGIRSEGN
ncbi:MAG: hypothetical protein IKF42_09665 [Mogibacterium sp.]|nr:hypothetical protein [Mogibacterium sp.]